MVSILIPTAARAPMLRTALKSIADQTAIGKVDRVVIVDNGTTREAERILHEFPSLKLVYQHSPEVDALGQKKILIQAAAESEFAAVLHDDDWWSPGHLERGLAALQASPTAAAYGNSNFVVTGESSMLNCNGNLFPWFAASYARFAPTWEVTRLNVLLGSLLGTFCHYSTLIARTDALRQSIPVYDQNNYFAHDRMLMFALATVGAFLFRPHPEVFIRFHGKQESFNHDSQAIDKQMIEATNWMVQASGKSWTLVAQSFVKRLLECPPSAVSSLHGWAMRPWCLPGIATHLDEGAGNTQFFDVYKSLKADSSAVAR